MLDPRGQLLRAALGFASCSTPSYDRALHALRSWLNSWSGIGHVAVGMARQGYDPSDCLEAHLTGIPVTNARGLNKHSLADDFDL
jgi:hypothetical protein